MKMDFLEIASFRKYLNIKQSLPGRMRIKFSDALLNDQKAVELFSSEIDFPAVILQIKVNMFSKTALILYDHNKLPQTCLEQLILVQGNEEAKKLALRINGILDI